MILRITYGEKRGSVSIYLILCTITFWILLENVWFCASFLISTNSIFCKVTWPFHLFLQKSSPEMNITQIIPSAHLLHYIAYVISKGWLFSLCVFINFFSNFMFPKNFKRFKKLYIPLLFPQIYVRCIKVVGKIFNLTFSQMPLWKV